MVMNGIFETNHEAVTVTTIFLWMPWLLEFLDIWKTIETLNLKDFAEKKNQDERLSADGAHFKIQAALLSPWNLTKLLRDP